MRWVKRGIVYCPDGQMPWARSHAMVPTPFRLNDDVIRVFVTFLDGAGIGRPGYVDVAAADPLRVLAVSTQPLLEDGQPGTFDENGLLACSVVRAADGRLYLYYAGFETGTRIRYRLLSGLAISEDDGLTFTRYRPTPILERSPSELFIRGGPFCLYEPPLYRLWYAGGSQWTDLNGKMMPVYAIRYLESPNGFDWAESGEVQIDITDPDEHGFGRPFVIRWPGGGYRMFYSVRRRSYANYRLGYAESTDGRKWTRMDGYLNLDVTPGSFDSEAIMYAAPILIGERLYLFYNGNEFGREGFALAELEVE